VTPRFSRVPPADLGGDNTLHTINSQSRPFVGALVL
jgi:hypothetical protein